MGLFGKKSRKQNRGSAYRDSRDFDDLWQNDFQSGAEYERPGNNRAGAVSTGAVLMFAFGLSVIILGLLAFIHFVVWPVELLSEHVVLELGDTLSDSPEDYLYGYEASVRFAQADFSEVRPNKLGTWSAKIKHGFDEYEFEVEVVDTTAPVLTAPRKDIYLEKNRPYDIEYLGISAEDISGDVTLTDRSGKNEICLNRMGSQTVEIVGRDSSGNKSSVQIGVIVDTAPVISGIKDIYVVAGREKDLLAGICANDNVDGNLTDRIQVETKDLNWKNNGCYEVLYKAADNYGLVGEARGIVNVLPQEDIDELLATRTINCTDQIIDGASNLLAAGAAPMASLEEQKKYMLPALVHLRIDYARGYASGSGYLIDAKGDYLYFCSNQHVLSHDGTKRVFFYDGTSAPYEVVDMNKADDVAVGKIRISDISTETFEHLKTVSLDRNAYREAAGTATGLFLEIVSEKGLDYTRDGQSQGLSREYDYVKNDMLKMSLKLVPGNSGSAILDENGNLIGMGTGVVYSNNNGHKSTAYYAVTMENILKYYEQFTGNRLYVRGR